MTNVIRVEVPSAEVPEDSIISFSGRHRFLSNFWVEEDGKTVEHRFAAAKTNDQGQKDEIFYAATPGLAKKAGRAATLRPDWDEVKDQIMYTFVWSKFAYDPTLRDKLLETGDALLFEGNTWHDYYWGVDLDRVRNGVVFGKNTLGRTLMRVRRELKEML